MSTASVLIVEDESIVALDLRLELQGLGYNVAGVVATAHDAVEAVAQLRPDLILMDVHLHGPLDGIDAAHAIARVHATPLIYLTSHSDNDTVRRAADSGAYGYLTKPYQAKELRAGIEVALAKSRMERKLREADRWFAHTLRCVADGVVVTDLQANVRFINAAAEQLTGWPTEAAAGHSVGEVVQLSAPGPDDAAGAGTGTPDALHVVQSVLREGRVAPAVHSLRLHPRSGQNRLVDQSAGPVDDDDGQRLGAVLVLRDAQTRLAQQAALRASEARFRSAFDFAPLGMALVSLQGELLLVNDAFCALLASDRPLLRSQSHVDLTHPEDRGMEAQHLQALQSPSQGVVQFEKRYLRGGADEPVSVLASVSTLRDEGQSSCYLYQVHDLTAQKRADEKEAALSEERMKRQASELAAAARTDFLSRVSHEMRTPLNAVIGLAQVLQLPGNTLSAVKVQNYAEHIRSAGEHLLSLVTDLLDLNLLNHGNLAMNLDAVDLGAVLRETLVLLGPQAQAHQVQLAADGGDLPRVRADQRRLRQVLLNVGSNAIKYNRVGGRVNFLLKRRDARSCDLVIEDTGIGMTPEQTARLFQPFDRLGAELTKVQGTGLGLVISLGLVQQMGGELAVHSAADLGTRVTLTLPYPEPGDSR